MDNEGLDMLPRDDLPAYSLRVSTRAKRLQIKVNHWGKVEVVVPRHVSVGHVAPFVRKHRKWLQHVLAEVDAARPGSSATAQVLPERVHLAAVGEDWDVTYREGEGTGISGYDEQRRLLVKTVDESDARVTLQAWLHDYARRRLPPWLQQVSEDCALSFARASVRAQKTRWGSCSAHGHINLNRHLMFLPPRLVRYIMIHELCHTVHLNHSRRYWCLVGRFAPDFKACETELRRAAHHIPLWACPA